MLSRFLLLGKINHHFDFFFWVVTAETFLGMIRLFIITLVLIFLRNNFCAITFKCNLVHINFGTVNIYFGSEPVNPKILWIYKKETYFSRRYVKGGRIRSFSGLYFPAFGLNMDTWNAGKYGPDKLQIRHFCRAPNAVRYIVIRFL